MRQRITYLYNATDPFDPASLKVTGHSLSLHSLKAAREARLTFGFNELPQELWRVLKQSHELHVRWASPHSYNSTAPFVSRVSPGLHVFFTPRKGISPDLLCGLLRKVFGELKCQTPEKSFTRLSLISERFSTSSAFQYHQPLASLDELTTYLQQKICPSSDNACHDKASTIQSASYLDIDYDTISHALVLNAFWERAPDLGLWNDVFEVVGGKEKVEVGVLASEVPTEPEELKLGGWLTVIGEDEKPSPALFSFPSRHHILTPTSSSTFSVSFIHPTGLHPTLRIQFPSSSNQPPLAEACALHTYLTLPSYLFADRYQLSDPLFLRSKGLRGLRGLYGETDLEAPDWVIGKWGSSMLVEIDVPSDRSTSSWIVDIPLHLRYLAPKSGGGATDVEVPWPVIFWACRAEEGSKMVVNPFDRVNLGYDGLFGPKTMFYHLSPQPVNSSGLLLETMSVPVLDLDKARTIEIGTMAATVLGFLWICWKLWLALGSRRTREQKINRKKAVRRNGLEDRKDNLKVTATVIHDNRIREGQYYEAHQQLRVVASRHVKQKNYNAAIDILFSGAQALLKAGQGGSGGDLCLFLTDIYKSAELKPDSGNKGKLIQLLRLFQPEEPSRKRFIGECIIWSSKFGEYPAGDPELHHVAGTLYAEEHDPYEAERHLILGTKDSPDYLARLEYEWYAEDESHTVPLYAARAVLPYLLIGNLRDATRSLQVFNSRLTETNKSLVAQDASSTTADLRIYPSSPLLNFLGLLLQSVQRGSSDLFRLLKNHYAVYIREVGAWDDALDQIGEMYFGIQIRRQTNPLMDMMGSLFGGPGAGVAGQPQSKRVGGPAPPPPVDLD
ncbi:MAG: protease B nonderepressible form [Geoglossum simile]|nr:MAG: protease B nonderepressible form [Geoglossum simile]